MDNDRNHVHTRSHWNTYLNFCVAAIMVMCIILIVSNDDNKQKFEERTNGVTQSEATLLDLMRKWERAPSGSEKKLKAQKEFDAEIARTKHGDNNLYRILNLLIGEETSSTMIPLAGQHVAEEEEEIDGFTQSEATLLYLILQWKRSPDGSEKKLKAQKELDAEIGHIKHDDYSVYRILSLLFEKEETSSTMLTSAPLPGAKTSCLKMMVKIYKQHCGILSNYGLKYVSVFGNMCNAGISEKQMINAASQACPEKNINNS
ncbi:vacuolar-processing enzyme [Trifolium repens]|nr:vacuolar-processing enzyme [Trifolium repens]